MVNIIAAVSDNGIIGDNGVIPWHLPEDLAHFRKLTTGHTVIMGRKTWDLIGHALPNRRNIVVTTQDKTFEGAQTAHSLDEAIEMADTDEVFIIGGGEIYKQAMDKADRLYITRVHVTVKGDTFFPEIDKDKWVLRHAAPAVFDGDYEVYERATARDRLIVAWKEYIKKNEIQILCDSGKVMVSESSSCYEDDDETVGTVSFAFDVFGVENITEVARMFKDMYRSLRR